MGAGTLTIYSASAGSGKTFKLAGVYLENVFKSRFNYRKILAVTFTNKATAEMKSRILEQLYILSRGEPSEYLKELIEKTGRSEEWIRKEAGEVLHSVLHDFSRFSVSTIDSFFQKILRSFTKEAGLYSGFNVEIDHSMVLSSAVDEMIASAADYELLKNWLTKFTRSNIEDEKGWNLKSEILKLAEELFREKFKLLTTDEKKVLEDKEYLSSYIDEMRSVSYSFEKQLITYGERCMEIFSGYGLTDEMFFQKGKGIPSFIRSIASGDIKAPNAYVRKIESDPPKWHTGIISPRLDAALKGGLDNAVREALGYYDRNIKSYKSVIAILSNIYSLGILSDVLDKIHHITTNENIFLLSDAGEVLRLITGSDQTSFIYEKTGNRYENYMIDEFQDTSQIQWENFRILIEDSMAGGNDNLVVGDIKQSIYRWRNSDWNILINLLKQVDNHRLIQKPLTTNFRSCSNIIQFNNTLFSIIPRMIDSELSEENNPLIFSEIYSEAAQNNPPDNKGGYVRIEFVEDSEEQKWNEIILQRLPSVIENLQDKGYNPSDIGIIVRDNREGAKIMMRMIDYANRVDFEKKRSYNYSIISNDSLLLANSYVISFIVAVLSVLDNPGDMINRAAMLRFFLLSTGDEDAGKMFLESDSLIERSQNYFPQGYELFLNSARQLPLFEITEGIVRFFGLGKQPWNLAYLSTFQDLVLNFSVSKTAGLQSFLEWWESEGIKKSVILPEQQNAIKVLTIHKSKGLEFNAVILPFLSWNLDHKSFYQPLLWVKPQEYPFNKIGIVPVKYKQQLLETIFDLQYREERACSFLDNLNLLYVAMTRARHVLYGFAPYSQKNKNSIASVIRNAVESDITVTGTQCISMNDFYNREKHVVEIGEITQNRAKVSEGKSFTTHDYFVSDKVASIKLKLRGEDYFSLSDSSAREKINYGILMHEIFAGIKTRDDISSSVNKLVLEGRLPQNRAAELEERITSLVCDRNVSEWFRPGINVITETEILMPSGNTRRPDRIIFKDNGIIIIDFKFGDENPDHKFQINHYRRLLTEMGFLNIEAFIWYVDKNKIISY